MFKYRAAQILETSGFCSVAGWNRHALVREGRGEIKRKERVRGQLSSQRTWKVGDEVSPAPADAGCRPVPALRQLPCPLPTSCRSGEWLHLPKLTFHWLFLSPPWDISSKSTFK